MNLLFVFCEIFQVIKIVQTAENVIHLYLSIKEKIVGGSSYYIKIK